MAKIQHHSDLELFKLIQKHDSKGLDELFRRYAHQLGNFAFQITRDIETSKELVSDIFFQIWLKRNQLDIQRNVKSYLYTALRNHCLNHLRKEQQQFEDLDVLEGAQHPSEFHADQGINQAETASLVETILKRLPPQRQLVFRLHRLDELSYKEIAEILAISEHTVHRHMVAAIKQLAEAYPKWKKLFITLGSLFSGFFFS